MIKAGKTKLDRIEIYDVIGTVVFAEIIEGKLDEINIEDLDVGVYFVKVFSDDNQKTLRFTVIR